MLSSGDILSWDDYLRWALEHAGQASATMVRGDVLPIDPETGEAIPYADYRAKYFEPYPQTPEYGYAETTYTELRPHPLGAGMSESITGVDPLTGYAHILPVGVAAQPGAYTDTTYGGKPAPMPEPATQVAPSFVSKLLSSKSLLYLIIGIGVLVMAGIIWKK